MGFPKNISFAQPQANRVLPWLCHHPRPRFQPCARRYSALFANLLQVSSRGRSAAGVCCPEPRRLGPPAGRRLPAPRHPGLLPQPPRAQIAQSAAAAAGADGAGGGNGGRGALGCGWVQHIARNATVQTTNDLLFHLQPVSTCNLFPQTLWQQRQQLVAYNSSIAAALLRKACSSVTVGVLAEWQQQKCDEMIQATKHMAISWGSWGCAFLYPTPVLRQLQLAGVALPPAGLVLLLQHHREVWPPRQRQAVFRPDVVHPGRGRRGGGAGGRL